MCYLDPYFFVKDKHRKKKSRQKAKYPYINYQIICKLFIVSISFLQVEKVRSFRKQACRSRGCHDTPDFGRSDNYLIYKLYKPISTRGADYAQITTPPPLDFQTSLRSCRQHWKESWNGEFPNAFTTLAIL